jgi:hypothetical protein
MANLAALEKDNQLLAQLAYEKKALLGEPLDIDWSRPEYKGKTTVVDGIRYMIDPADPTKVFAIGKEE